MVYKRIRRTIHLTASIVLLQIVTCGGISHHAVSLADVTGEGDSFDALQAALANQHQLTADYIAVHHRLQEAFEKGQTLLESIVVDDPFDPAALETVGWFWDLFDHGMVSATMQMVTIAADIHSTETHIREIVQATATVGSSLSPAETVMGTVLVPHAAACNATINHMVACRVVDAQNPQEILDQMVCIQEKWRSAMESLMRSAPTMPLDVQVGDTPRSSGGQVNFTISFSGEEEPLDLARHGTIGIKRCREVTAGGTIFPDSQLNPNEIYIAAPLDGTLQDVPAGLWTFFAFTPGNGRSVTDCVEVIAGESIDVTLERLSFEDIIGLEETPADLQFIETGVSEPVSSRPGVRDIALLSAGQAFFEGDISIAGEGTESFSPRYTTATIGNITSGNRIVVAGCPSITAATGTLENPWLGTVLTIMLNPGIAGPGTFEVSEEDIPAGAPVTVIFSTPKIRNNNFLSDSVIFSQTGGKIILDACGQGVGERLTGSFMIAIRGEREVDDNPENDVTIKGAISGRFDIPIQSSDGAMLLTSL